MLGPLDYAVWLLGFGAEVYVLILTLLRREFLRYLSLNVYVLALAVMTATQFVVFRRYGFQSAQYLYVYYYTDAIVTIVMYVAVMGLYLHVFQDLRLGKYIRGFTIAVLAATALFSFAVVQHNSSHLTGRFVVELGQNLYFIGVAMTYVLWAAMVKFRTTRLRLIVIVSTFGLFFSLQAATYGLRNLFPALAIWHVIPPLVGAWLPLSLAFAFTRVPDEARILTARIAGARE
jgi:hypothetical protein